MATNNKQNRCACKLDEIVHYICEGAPALYKRLWWDKFAFVFGFKFKLRALSIVKSDENENDKQTRA